MGDENHIRTLGDYCKPSYEGYRNTIDLPVRNNMDVMIGKINLLWKTVSEKLNDVSTSKNAGNSMAPKSIAAISQAEREELRKKGIKSPKNDEDVSSTKAHEHGLGNMMRNKEEVKEQGKEEDEMEIDKEVEEVFEDEESEIEIEEQVEEVFDDETEKEEDDDTKYYNSPPAIKELVYHEWLLKNP
uniref:Uncharacterized protein n=1 Tax=Tanacetum cinerariifolium TaxID=118510 RepID=A0A6L2JBH2_TANCI|nr:hypothetical protein [Tanacetum cinerariifolium]